MKHFTDLHLLKKIWNSPSKPTYFILFWAMASLLLLSVFSVCIGNYPLSMQDITHILLGNAASPIDTSVFYQVRLPRATMAILAGIVLGISGGIYQLVFENALASPDLTGVASGAALGAAVAMFLGYEVFVRIGFAFAGGVITLALVLLVVYAVKAVGVYVYILVGLIVSSAAQAGLMLLKALANKEGIVIAIEYWTMGSFSAMTSQKLLYAAIIAVPAVLILLLFEKQAKILSMGAETALSVGLSVSFWRAVLLILSTLAVSAIVSVSGVISFAGLIAPHIVFLLIKHKGSFYLLLCGIAGGILLVSADLLARCALSGIELPLSVFTVMFALPIFIILLLQRGKNHA